MQHTKRLPSFPVACLCIFIICGSITLRAQPVKKNIAQPVLGVRTAAIITVAGLRFKDLNRNGRLDPYEDWRLTSEERSKDLLARMSIEEKVGFMLISSAGLKNEASFGAGAGSGNPITSDFNEEDRVSTVNVFTRKPLPYPIMNIAGTTKGVTQFHLRHFILRANTTARIMAEWANKITGALRIRSSWHPRHYSVQSP